MANEKLEIEILANGKPAEKAIKGVEKKTEDLGKTSKRTGDEADGMLTRMKAGWIAVGASVAIAINKAATFERASIGLTKAQKEWAKETALASDIGAEQVAGFLKSAETAGLAEDQMKNLAKQAIALGYAFPHEDAETLHDNLVMLNTTGEAQGFMVDILEQKMAKMGIAFEDMDLKAISMADKLKIVNEVVADSQKQMDASKYTEFNEVLGKIDTAFINMGDTLVKLGSETGAFKVAKFVLDGLQVTLGLVAVAANEVVKGVKSLVSAFSDEALEAPKKAVEEQLTAEQKLAKMLEFKAQLTKELTIATGAHRQAIEKQLETVDKQIASLQTTGDTLHNVADKSNEAGDATVKLGDKLKELNARGKTVTSSLADYFSKLATGVNASFSDMAKNVIQRLIQIKMEAQITSAIARAADSGGIIGDIAGWLTSDHTGRTEVKHTGGTIGIPSFHSGFRSDERLAKLQVGEAVINRHGAAKNRGAIDAMNAGYTVGGQGMPSQTANITFQVQAFDSASFQQGMVQNRATIVGVVREAFNRNGKTAAL